MKSCWSFFGYRVVIKNESIISLFYYIYSRYRRRLSWCWNVTVAKSICHLLRSVINCSNWFSCLFCWLLVTLGPYHTVLALLATSSDSILYTYFSQVGMQCNLINIIKCTKSKLEQVFLATKPAEQYVQFWRENNLTFEVMCWICTKKSSSNLNAVSWKLKNKNHLCASGV